MYNYYYQGSITRVLPPGYYYYYYYYYYYTTTWVLHTVSDNKHNSSGILFLFPNHVLALGLFHLLRGVRMISYCG